MEGDTRVTIRRQSLPVGAELQTACILDRQSDAGALPMRQPLVSGTNSGVPGGVSQHRSTRPNGTRRGRWMQRGGRVIRDTRYQGAVIREHHLLLLKQTDHARERSYWLLPGGRREPNETEQRCVQLLSGGNDRRSSCGGARPRTMSPPECGATGGPRAAQGSRRTGGQHVGGHWRHRARDERSCPRSSSSGSAVAHAGIALPVPPDSRCGAAASID